MKNSLIYSAWGITSEPTKNLINQIRILNTTDSKINLLTNATTDSGKKYIENIANIKIREQINLFSNFYENRVKKLENWIQVYDELNVCDLEKYDAFYIFGGIFSSASKLRRGTDRNYVFPRDNGQLRFESIGKHLLNILAVLKAHTDYCIPIHDICYDPLEYSLSLFHPDYQPKSNYFLYHGYDMPAYNMHRLDSMQYYLNFKKKFFQIEKTLDFVFGMTVMEADRMSYYEYADLFSKKFQRNFFVANNKFNNINTFVDRDKYLNFISASKYTLILPAYDTNSFSIYRLIESLSNDCLPFIHQDCIIDDVEKSFNVDLSMLKTDKIFSESQRLEILEYLKSKILVVEKLFK